MYQTPEELWVLREYRENLLNDVSCVWEERAWKYFRQYGLKQTIRMIGNTLYFRWETLEEAFFQETGRDPRLERKMKRYFYRAVAREAVKKILEKESL